MSSTENNYVNTDLGNVALNSCGEYNADSSYEYLDTVNYEGGSYFCKVEFPKKISGIAPKAGVSTEFWQLLTIPGDATSEYIKLHDEVVNKAKQVETSRAAVELSQTEVEAAQTDVSQMRQDTQEAAEEAASSRDSAAGYAQSAEASRTAAKESEDNINAQVTGFDVHAAEKTSETESAITEARRVAVNAVSTKQDDATQAVIDEGDKQIKNVEDAGTEQVGKAKSAGESAVSAAGAAGVSAVNAVKAQQTASIKAIQEAGKNALQNISNGVDKGLSEEGKAADAKATGEAISKLTKEISLIKEDTTALQKRQNVLVGSETGNPVSCDDAYSAPLCGLTVYGRSTQDGTPTPDNPVPIVSAGDGGTIAVTLSDGNGKTQTLILPTPTGLPGVPVASGGNYTDQNGQQWICDEVDLERGVKVQRVKSVDISSLDKSFWVFRKDIDANVSATRYSNKAVIIDFRASAPAMSNILPAGVGNDVNTFRLVATPLYLYQFNLDSSKFPTVESWVEYLKANTVLIIYAPATPIETPLTPAEIAAYKAITAYAPDTVVQASDGAGIKLDYQRDVNLVVKNLEDAIASMTTT